MFQVLDTNELNTPSSNDMRQTNMIYQYMIVSLIIALLVAGATLTSGATIDIPSLFHLLQTSKLSVGGTLGTLGPLAPG